MMQNKLTLSVSECAEKIGIGRNLCYDLIRRGEIPSLKLGGRIVVPVVALEKLMHQAGELAD